MGKNLIKSTAGFITLLFVFSFLSTGCLILSRRAFPKVRGSVSVEGIEAPVEIVRDSYGVPHIYAHNIEDLYFAQGYVHAQDRFWQMEFQRRVAGGRLSELFGEATLETDIFMRTLGFERVAAVEYQRLDENERRTLDSYVAGINAYIRDRKPGKISLEYALLNLSGTEFEVEEWEPVHSLTWGKILSWSMSSNLETERFLLDLLRTAGLGGTEYYYPPYRDEMPFIISDEELGRESAENPAPEDTAVDVRFARWIRTATGSRSEGTNSWVVSGDLSVTGKPILANDTHLGVQMPSIWYEIGLHIVDESGQSVGSDRGGIQARGISSPGHPGVLIGHNDRMAWGVSDFGDDIQDLFVEKINPEKPNQYEVNGRWEEMDLIHERIDIQGQEEPFVHIVRQTRHGPIISDRGGYKVMETFGYSPELEFPDNLELNAAALRWTALEPDRFWGTVYRLQTAASVDDFRYALSLTRGPILNFIFADTEGNIGYQIVGSIPIRRTGEGRIPVPGWNDQYEWTGFVPFEDLPSVLNPEKDYIVACNNPAVPFDFPYDLGTTWVNGYRARRIADLIEQETDGISMEDAVRIQSDVFDRTASEIIPYLAELDLSAPDEPAILEPKEALDKKEQKEREKTEEKIDGMVEEARRILLEWDNNMEMESAGAAVYGLFFVALTEATFKDQFPYQRWDRASNRRFEGACYLLMQEPDNPWWDDIRTLDVRETRDIILVKGLRAGLRMGIELIGDDIEKWEWKDLHTIEFREPTLGESGKKQIEKLFNLGPVPVPGGTLTVFHTSWRNGEPFAVVHTTTHRQITDLNDLSNSLLIHTPGQSGHAKHRHYDDFIEPWSHAEYHPTNWTREEAEEGCSPTLVLHPEG
ncbi:MAG: penicillin acylase family protein [Sediminispirochaetaceae bacterium]